MTTRYLGSGTERLQFLKGALLSARDLQDDVAYESRMRGLHTRVMHNTWGIARGYDVHLNQARDAVLVGPGIAYDCAGREIISARSLAINRPSLPAGDRDDRADAWWFDLAISYDDLATVPYGGDAGCLDDEGGRAEERPRWRWVYAGATAAGDPPLPLADDIRLGEEVPLARIALTDRETIASRDVSVRRHAQALVRPHIGRGYLPQGSAVIDGNLLAWSVWVDTRAAGFSRTPFYFCNLDGQWLDAIEEGVSQDDDAAEEFRRFLGPFISIESPTSTGFTLHVRFALTGVFSPDMTAISAAFGRVMAAVVSDRVSLPLPVGVRWFGVEPVEGCQPMISIASVQWLSLHAFDNPTFAFRNLLLQGAFDPNVFEG